jgi:hypothetical protein
VLSARLDPGLSAWAILGRPFGAKNGMRPA